MTLPQVYEIFGYWKRNPPLTELVRMLALRQGIKAALPTMMPGAAPEPRAFAPAPHVTAAPDPSRPLADPLPEHDAAVRQVAQMMGATLPTKKIANPVSLEDYVARITAPKSPSAPSGEPR